MHEPLNVLVGLKESEASENRGRHFMAALGGWLMVMTVWFVMISDCIDFPQEFPILMHRQFLSVSVTILSLLISNSFPL